MLVDRQFVFLLVVPAEVLAEPVGEDVVDPVDRFAYLPPGQGCTAATGFVGDDDGETRICRPCPEGGFAQAGVPHQDDLGGIHQPVCFEVIQDTAVAPGPGGDRLSAICRNIAFRWITEEGEDAFGISVFAVGEEVEVVDGGKTVTGIDDLF